MKRIMFLIAFLPAFGFSQNRAHLTLSGGFFNYYGDLQSKPLTLDQAHGAFGAGIKYDLTSRLALRGGVMFGRISADDKRNKASLRPRNLNFESKIFEGNVMAEYSLFDLSDRKLTPYLAAGIAVFHFNPYTHDSAGAKHFLQPLGTEGQGQASFPDRKEYKLTQFAIPIGAGVRFRVSDKVALAYEFTLRKTFTDYLDDVSSTYADPAELFAARGAKAVELSYRGGELKDGDPNYPAAGTKRGGANAKDWYYFSGLTVSIGLGNTFTGNGKGRISCPVF